MMIQERRRIFLGGVVSPPAPVLNGIKTGTYGQITVSDKNHLAFTANNAFINKFMPLIDDIVIHSGDVIKLRAVNGTMLTGAYGACGLYPSNSLTGGLEITTSQKPPIKTTFQSKTATSDFTAKYFRIYQGSVASGTAECDLELYINDVQVI